MENRIRKLYIEASSRCNLACRMCFRKSWIDEGFGDLDPALFSNLLDDPALAQTETVFFGGMGEPLVHPQIIEMVAEASEHGKYVELITNGTLLDQSMSEALLSAGLKRLWISVDDIYENYEKIQRGGSFGKVYRHVEAFNKLRAGTDVRLGMTSVLMRDNIGALSGIKDFARQCGADDLNLSHMIPCHPEDEYMTLWSMCQDSAQTTQYSRKSFSMYQYRLLAAMDEPENEGEDDAEGEIPMFTFSELCQKELFPGKDDLNEKELFSWKGTPALRRTNYCRFIEEGHCFVRWDGDIAPCMGLLHSSVTYLHEQKRTVWRHSFGNLSRQSLSEIWNSEEYTAFRERVHAYSFSPCIHCGGCNLRTENRSDCTGNPFPVCGACLWGQGFISCP